MRKLIIKFFALSYKFKLGDIAQLRASTVIFPLILLTMISINQDWMIKYLFGALFVVSLFFGFIYFNIYPLKDEDIRYLDNVQLWYYNQKKNKPVKEAYSPNWILFINAGALILTIIYFTIYYAS